MCSRSQEITNQENSTNQDDWFAYYESKKFSLKVIFHAANFPIVKIEIIIHAKKNGRRCHKFPLGIARRVNSKSKRIENVR
jgi:hypothetical protein